MVATGHVRFDKTANQASGPGLGAGPHLAGDSDAAVCTPSATAGPPPMMKGQESPPKIAFRTHSIVESVGAQLSKDLARLGAFSTTRAAAATTAAAARAAAAGMQDAPSSPVPKARMASTGSSHRGPRFGTEELLWALARSEKRRTALEEQLAALRALPTGLASFQAVKDGEARVKSPTGLLSDEERRKIAEWAIQDRRPESPKSGRFYPSDSSSDYFEKLRKPVLQAEEDLPSNSTKYERKVSIRADAFVNEVESHADDTRLQSKAAAVQRPTSPAGAAAAALAANPQLRSPQRKGLGARTPASRPNSLSGLSPPWAMIVGGTSKGSSASSKAAKLSSEQLAAAPHPVRRSLTVNVPAAQDLDPESQSKRHLADMAGVSGNRTKNKALFAKSQSEGLLQPLPECSAVCMPVGSERRRGDSSRRSASADRYIPGISAGTDSKLQSQNFDPFASTKTADRLDLSGLHTELTKLPVKTAAQLRKGFARLTAEVRTLRIRHEEQIATQQHLRAQIVSRDALNDRLDALEAEKISYSEWANLQGGVPKEGFTAPVDSKNQTDQNIWFQETKVLAQELWEGHLMLREDLLSERWANHEKQSGSGKLCEELCVLLHHCEEALRSALEEENGLRRSEREQAMLATRSVRSTTPTRSAELRLLHQKLAGRGRPDPKKNP